MSSAGNFDAVMGAGRGADPRDVLTHRLTGNGVDAARDLLHAVRAHPDSLSAALAPADHETCLDSMRAATKAQGRQAELARAVKLIDGAVLPDGDRPAVRLAVLAVCLGARQLDPDVYDRATSPVRALVPAAPR